MKLMSRNSILLRKITGLKKVLAGTLVSLILTMSVVSDAGAVVESAVKESGTFGSFADLKDGHWAKEQIHLAVQKGYVSGFPDGTFRPDDKVTRAQFIRMLADALKLPHVEQGTPWYQPYVAALVETGIHQETDFDADFNKPLTRYEMARLSVRATEPQGQFENKLWMVYATEKGLIHGVGGGELQPSGHSTRAQAVAVIERVLAINAGKRLPTDEKAIENAKIEAYHHNLFKFGFTDVVRLPVTVEDKSGFKVTINSIYAYNREESKPIVRQYELSEARKIDGKMRQVWRYDLYQEDYTLFLYNITVKNDSKKEQGFHFDDLDREYSLTSAVASPHVTPPATISKYREGYNREDYGYEYRLKPGESFTTNQITIFKEGDLKDKLYFNVIDAYTVVANIPPDKAR